MTQGQGTSRLPDLGERGEGWFYGQLALIAAVVALAAPLFPHVEPGSAASSIGLIAGVAALVTGGLLTVLATRELGDSLSPLPRPRRRAQLVETGVYRLIRHPIYAGLVVMAVGWSGVTGSLASLAASLVLAVFLDLKARREEAWLVERFPGYAAYQARSKRFVPGLY